MLQPIFIGILLLAAAVYLGRLVYRMFTVSSCESGCGKCGTFDVDEILKSVEQKKSTA